MSRHPHYEIIKEWIEDSSKRVEYRCDELHPWETTDAPSWSESLQYRLTPAKKEVVSSLSLEDIDRIYRKSATGSRDAIRDFINAAAARERVEIIKWLRSRGEAARRIAEELENR